MLSANCNTFCPETLISCRSPWSLPMDLVQPDVPNWYQKHSLFLLNSSTSYYLIIKRESRETPRWSTSWRWSSLRRLKRVGRCLNSEREIDFNFQFYLLFSWTQSRSWSRRAFSRRRAQSISRRVFSELPIMLFSITIFYFCLVAGPEIRDCIQQVSKGELWCLKLLLLQHFSWSVSNIELF